MTECSLGIVECLKKDNINPEAFASDYESSNRPSNALINDNSYFQSSTTKSNQWWSIDFKKNIEIDSYMIKTLSSACFYIRQWLAYVSINNKDWTLVDKVTDGPPLGKTYALDQPVVARYFRINGSSSGCTPSACFSMNYIKFIGKLNPTLKYRADCSCSCRKTRSKLLYFITLVICS